MMHQVGKNFRTKRTINGFQPNIRMFYRYAEFVNEAITWANEQAWPDYTDGSGCHDTCTVYGSKANPRNIALKDNTLKLYITDNGVEVDFTLGKLKIIS